VAEPATSVAGRLTVDIERIRSRLGARYPALHFVEHDGGWLLRGSIAIEERGHEIDCFQVEIDLRPQEVGELPVVRETGGRIPWTADRHINPDGSACVCLPEAYLLDHVGAFDLLTYLDGPVRGFFVGQALVESGQAWPQGEWSHGKAGLDEWWTARFASLSRSERRAWLRVLRAKTIKHHKPCPCRSGRDLRHCHRALVERLRQFHQLLGSACE
jgi:hypothetical protein